MSKEIKVSVGLTFECTQGVDPEDLLNRYFRGVKRSLKDSVGNVPGVLEWVGTDLRINDIQIPNESRTK